MKPYYQDKWVIIYYGDSRDVLPSLNGGSAVVTDPPYELGFMGKSWDSKGVSFQKETWEVIRQLCLSGAMLLSFGGTRTFHRIACAIEDAGWEIRDTVMWVYGSGFPKSLDISKALDKQQGIWRGKSQGVSSENRSMAGGNYKRTDKGFPISPEAQLWEGYGTALKPAYEPIILAMNPLDGTFANNALKHGVAGLNIDECRIPTNWDERPESWKRSGFGKKPTTSMFGSGGTGIDTSKGRFPANFLHDGSQMVMELFPQTKSGAMNSMTQEAQYNTYGKMYARRVVNPASNGSAARFFYCAKASKAERDRGCEGLEEREYQSYRSIRTNRGAGYEEASRSKNNHPTVKPLALMEYLCKLVKMPEYNLILDPFCGSGTTLLACIRLGIPCIGIDSDESSCEIAARRCQEALELV